MPPRGRDRIRQLLAGRGLIPIWLKVPYTAFLCLMAPIYWQGYGPTVFLWACDIALVMLLIALWREQALPNSMMAIGVLPFELIWIVDFAFGSRLIGMASYMFDATLPLYLRAFSLYHLVVPVIMIFLLRRLGYDRRALVAQTLLICVVLPATYLLTDPADNINLVFGPGKEAQTAIHPLLYLALEMVLLPLVVCLPMHLLLRRLVKRA